MDGDAGTLGLRAAAASPAQAARWTPILSPLHFPATVRYSVVGDGPIPAHLAAILKKAAPAATPVYWRDEAAAANDVHYVLCSQAWASSGRP